MGIFNCTTDIAKDLSDIELYPYNGICGKCGRYAHKINKDALCESCEFFGVKKIITGALPENILKFLELRK